MTIEKNHGLVADGLNTKQYSLMHGEARRDGSHSHQPTTLREGILSLSDRRKMIGTDGPCSIGGVGIAATMILGYEEVNLRLTQGGLFMDAPGRYPVELPEGVPVNVGRANHLSTQGWGLDKTVSPIHVRVTNEDGSTVRIQDRGSLNGTKVVTNMPFTVEGSTIYEKALCHWSIGSSEHFVNGTTLPLEVPLRGVFGVVDSVNDGVDPDTCKIATEKAGQVVKIETNLTVLPNDFINSWSKEADAWTLQTLKEASRLVEDNSVAHAKAAAAIGRIVETNGHKYLAWASVGAGAQLYLLRGGQIQQLNSDEQEGEGATNWLGHPQHHISQHGSREVYRGDRLLCITSGVGLPTDELLGYLRHHPDDPAAAARLLVDRSRETYDRSAVVVDVK